MQLILPKSKDKVRMLLNRWQQLFPNYWDTTDMGLFYVLYQL